MQTPSPFFIERTFTLKALNGISSVLKLLGIDPFKLNATQIIRKASKRAQFEGDLPGQVGIGINRLVNSINRQAAPNPFGKLAAGRLFERTLYGRLKIEQTLTASPEIANTVIKEPIFIIGMPRTGTTILHALLHQDPAHRSPLSWECLLPYPPPNPENFDSNNQLNTIRKEFDQLFKLVPDFKRKHHMEADSPQECIGINAFDFNSFQPSAQFYIPDYMDWFNNKADRLETMRFHKHFLQYLQSGGVSGERWLLKSPVHLMRLTEIFEVYPDAKIIMTHRHPAKVVASAASLISSVRSLYSDHEDPLRSGVEQLNIWSDYFERFLAIRKQLDREDQIIDLKFEDFVKDQMGIVKQIYEHFNWQLTPLADQKMNEFLAANPKDKHGVHDYSLEMFGLNDKEIEDKFSRYIDFLNTLK